MHVRYRWLSQCSRVFLWAHCLHIERGREWLNRLNAETLWKGQLLKGNHAVNFSLGKTALFLTPQKICLFSNFFYFTWLQFIIVLFNSGALARPQELRCPNGDPFFENANSVDENVRAKDQSVWKALKKSYFTVLQRTNMRLFPLIFKHYVLYVVNGD